HTRSDRDWSSDVCSSDLASTSPAFPIEKKTRERSMITRRHVIASALAAPAILRLGTGTARAATTLKISHQFPGGTIEKGDFRDRDRKSTRLNSSHDQISY